MNYVLGKEEMERKLFTSMCVYQIVWFKTGCKFDNLHLAMDEYKENRTFFSETNICLVPLKVYSNK